MPRPDTEATLDAILDDLRDNRKNEWITAAVLIARLRERGLDVTENFIQMQDRERRERIEARQRAEARAKAGAIPYAGAITQCQAAAPDRGMRIGDHRCGGKAKWVVRRRERPGKRGEAYDGRLAVCAVHAKDERSSRYMGHWSHERDAGEAVEDQYQPETTR